MGPSYTCSIVFITSNEPKNYLFKIILIVLYLFPQYVWSGFSFLRSSSIFKEIHALHNCMWFVPPRPPKKTFSHHDKGAEFNFGVSASLGHPFHSLASREEEEKTGVRKLLTLTKRKQGKREKKTGPWGEPFRFADRVDICLTHQTWPGKNPKTVYFWLDFF